MELSTSSILNARFTTSFKNKSRDQSLLCNQLTYPLSECEKRFIEWVDFHKYNWTFIDQRPETYAKNFRGKLKRLDFQLNLPMIGNILIDVKERNFKDIFNFTIDKEEILKFQNVQSQYHQLIWIVFSTRAIDFRTWYWVNVSQPFNYMIKLNKVKNSYFYTIPIENCITIGWNDSIETVCHKWLDLSQ